MTKRIISFLLLCAMLLGFLAMGVSQVSAAYDMKASEDIIALIKSFEGFAATPYQDNGQWSVGYGTGVSGTDLAEYQKRGITEAEADQLMRRYVADFETDVNAFARNFGLNFSQNEFDALISFTYNLGSDWMNNDSTLRQVIISRDTGEEFIFAIARWCTASGNIIEHLITRRLAEANVYINGVYSRTPPKNYCYIHYNENIDKPYVNDVRIHAFDSNTATTLRSQPTKSGYRFLGWYTKPTGGEWISSLKAGAQTMDLYAHWQLITDASASVNGIAANYQRTVGGNVSGSVRQTPSLSAEEISTLSEGKTVTITADYLDADGNKWGKLSTGGWIVIHTGILMNEPQGKPITPVTVKVLQDGVNIRTGPGTKYSSLGQFAKGDELTITAVDNGGSYLWGLSSRGWICLRYTNYDLVSMLEGEDATTVTATGTVYRTDKLNVRSGPGTKYEKVAQLNKGDYVSITLQKDVNGTTWGLTEDGWVSMYYIQLDDEIIERPSGSTPETPETPSQPSGSSFTGVVVNCSELNVREGAGTKYAKVGKLKAGTQVEILEQTSVYGQSWGRIAQGWVSLNYIEKVTAGQEETPIQPSEPEADQVIDSGVIVKCSVLNVRSGAGTKYPKVGKLEAGTQVNIYEKTDVYGQSWGRTDEGWISLYYFSSGTASETPGDASDDNDPAGSTDGTTGGIKGTVVNCSSLNVRANAGTKYAKVGSLTRGTQVTILEQVTVNGKAWGRMEDGWVHMYYIKLEGTDSSASGGSTSGSTGGSGSSGSTGTQDIQIGVIVKTKELTIREAAGTGNAKVGTLQQGTKVVILETTKVGGSTWGRIEQGWISLYYVQLSDEVIPEGAVVRTVTVNGLNIRSAAGTGNAKVGTYAKGTQVIILEQTDHYGQSWGRTEKGWISLDYTA